MLNNKGFAVTSVLYTLLIAFLLFLGAALAQFSSSTKILSKANDDLTNNIKLPYETRIYYLANGGEIDNNNYMLNNNDNNSIIPKNGNNNWAVFASTSSLGNYPYEIVRFPYKPKSSEELGLKKNGYYFNGWTTRINYLYKEKRDGANYHSKNLDNTIITLNKINEYVKKNNTTEDVSFLQVFYEAKWNNFNDLKFKVNVNVYYNVAKDDDYEDTAGITYNNSKYELKSGDDGLFIKYKNNKQTVALASSAISGFQAPSFPIKSSNLDYDFNLKKEGYEFKGWEATIHSSCDTEKRYDIKDNISMDDLKDKAKELDTDCDNAALKIIYNANWEKN